MNQEAADNQSGISLHEKRNWGWKKGQSGNPKGRPKKGLSITEAIKAELEDPDVLKKFAQQLVVLACEGNPAAIRQVLDRVDGPVTARVNQEVTLEIIDKTSDGSDNRA